MPIGEETSTPRHLPPAGCDGQIASLGILQAAAQASPPCTPPTRQLSGGLALESIFGVGPPATGGLRGRQQVSTPLEGGQVWGRAAAVCTRARRIQGGVQLPAAVFSV